MTEKDTSFTEVGDGLYAFTAEWDPNSGVISGDDSVMIVEARGIAHPRIWTDKRDLEMWEQLQG